MKFFNVGIKGFGSYLPSKVVTNYDIEKRVNTTNEWIQKKLGINQRRVVEDELTSDLGFKAAKEALKSSNMEIDDIDLIVVATSSPEKISPSISCTIHNKFKTKKNIPCFDMNAVCSGFVYAVNFVTPLIGCGVYKNVLIIATETYSKITNWDDPHCVFFGDGAGAIILGKTNKGWISFISNANGGETGMTGFNLPLDSKFIMKGKEVWNAAIKFIPQSVNDVLTISDTNIKDIDLIIPHQPNINIIKEIANILNIPLTKFKTIMSDYANIAGASIPIALNDAFKKSEIPENYTILLTSIGSGWTWGSTIISNH